MKTKGKSFILFTGLSLIVIFFVFAAFNLFLIPWMQYSFHRSKFEHNYRNDLKPISESELAALQQKLLSLNRKMERLTPGNVFLIVNTTENTFALYKNNQLVHNGICSTGSFIELEVDSTTSYTFETPKGVLTIKGKITNPVWYKPDWAFIEEGLPVPSKNHYSRYEKNVLGDYALSLGNGYLIHGTYTSDC